MQSANAKTHTLNKGIKYTLISGLSLILLVIIAITGISLYISFTKNDVIYPNIYVNDTHIGNMTVEEASLALEDAYTPDDKILKFKYDDNEFEINAKDIKLTYNHFSTVMKAFEEGKSDNIFNKIFCAFTYAFGKHNIPIELTFNEDKLFKLISDNLPGTIDPVLKTTVVIEDENLAITNGSEGTGVDIAKLSEKIKESIGNGKDETFEIIIEHCLPTKYTAEKLYEYYHADPVDAVFSLPPEKPGYKQSQTGIDFDIEEARKILKENENSKETYYIPLTVTLPEKNDNWFIDNYGEELGSFSTIYNAGVIGRSENIYLASEKINGLILKPGEEFSFNNVVGKRSSENGFKTASVYQGGKVVDGIGGGICQVSSTLFNAVVYADLDIVYRTNHSMPVSYVANGRDATVSYGEIDFIFANNYPYPVRIDVTNGGGRITCSIKGIKTENKKIEIVTETVGTTQFKEKIVEDENMPEGERKIETKGTIGSVVNTYKITYIDGVETERKLLTRSNYIPTEQVVIVGTKKDKEPIEEPTNTEETEPSVPTGSGMTIPEIEFGGDITDFESIEE